MSDPTDAHLQGIAGVYWTIFMHAVLLIANCFSIRQSWIELRKKNTSKFWTSCLVVSVMLLAPSIQNILVGIQLATRAYQLRLYYDLIGNLAARLGIMVVTILRLYRLKIISRHPNRQKKFLLQSSVIAAVLLIACVTNIWWVMQEEAYWHLTVLNNGGQGAAPPSLALVQQIEGVYGLFSLLLVTVFNVVADYWFVKTIITVRKSARGDGGLERRRYLKTYLAFLPTITHFAICFVLYSIYMAGIPASYSTYVAMSHLMAVPATVLFTFVHSTIPATKALVGYGSSKQPSGESSSDKKRQSVSCSQATAQQPLTM